MSVEFTTSAKKFNGQESEREVRTSYNFGETLEEIVEKFGEEAVRNAFVTATKVDIQAMLRRKMEVGKKVEGSETPIPYTDEELQEMVDEYKPGVRAKGDSKTSALKKLVGDMSPEQLAELIARAKELVG